MTDSEKLTMTKTLLGMDPTDSSEDERIKVYLRVSEREILSWRYSYCLNSMPMHIPMEYEMVQIHAVLAGYTISGAEGQDSHSENGVVRMFHYPDMIAYIRANVIPMAKVLL